jgi:transposase
LGGAEVGATKQGKGTKLMLMIDGEGTPLSTFITSANHAEVNAIETLVDARVTEKQPRRLIYDRAADADWIRASLAARQIELICPHRRGRKKPALQDGRPLRRYRRRFKVERTISWLFNLRRLVVRYEYHDSLFEGFLQLGCLFTIIKWF